MAQRSNVTQTADRVYETVMDLQNRLVFLEKILTKKQRRKYASQGFDAAAVESLPATPAPADALTVVSPEVCCDELHPCTCGPEDDVATAVAPSSENSENDDTRLFRDWVRHAFVYNADSTELHTIDDVYCRINDVADYASVSRNQLNRALGSDPLLTKSRVSRSGKRDVVYRGLELAV